MDADADADAEGEKESLDEDKGIEKTELAKGQSQTEVNELKVDEAIELGKRESNSGVHGRDVLQQQTQGAVACWEILHVRSIRVLLVENDDSTRHVVMALLRNCNYEVLEAAHAWQAWKILEDLSNRIDIVLTEVEMPGISGVGLLLKIMSHKTRKNVPVIMMSSRDSMGLVFKCLSKGAVDFLVKPIRKNELKNLWQHVWRRCHSSSGSGSESGTQTQRSVKTKGSDKSGNASDGGENDGSNGLNIEDGSDDGSGAQSSWTKQAVEVDSPQALSPMDQVADCQDSTCGQAIRSNAEHSDKKKVHVSVEPEGHVQKQPDTFEKGKDLETIFHSSLEPKSENFVESQHDLTDRECEPTRKVVSKLDINNNAADDSKEPNCELSLKRARGDQDSGKSVQDDRFVLRRSEQSAFSRYNSPTNLLKAPNGITGSSSIHDNSIDAARRESIGDPILWKNSTGVSNNIDMGSTTNKLPKDKSEASESNRIHPSAFRPVKNDLKYSQQEVSPLPNGIQSTSLLPIRGSHQIQQHHHQNYQHHPHNHNHFHRENQPSTNHESSSLEKLAADASHCGSSNVLGGPIDGNSGNSSLNRSASGSNHGFSGQNGSNTAINNNPGNNAESDGGQVGKGGSGGASGSGSGIGSGNRGDGNKLALREAALIKFRQKRKDRCFKKRVRYQNRQKIAEQRPRVKGQFVKQAGADDSSRNEDE